MKRIDRLFFVALVSAGCGGSSSTTPSNDAATDTTGDSAVDVPPGDADAAAPPVTSCPGADKYKQAYFGDLHTHTSFSADAFGFGTRNTPVDAFKFARGAKLTIAPGSGGPTTKLDRPLDFDAVTDHSEWLTFAYGCGTNADGTPLDPTSPFFKDGTCDAYRAATGLKAIAAADAASVKFCGGNKEENGACLPVVRSAWKASQDAANAANVPCEFTAFIAYEWTHALAGATLHRNVVFSGGKVPDVPFDSLDYPTSVALWSALDASCKTADGCAALTIPHNSNKSHGGAFDIPPGATALDQIRRYQKLVEIHQHKGNSECYSDGSPTSDVTCLFEHLTPGADGPDIPQNYVRWALGQGLLVYSTKKANPLQLGIVGATDDHNGTPGNTNEPTWPGHAGRNDDSPLARLTGGAADKNPGGLTGVWAEQNTRDSIFAALARRETFATSGVRIKVRLHQTWDAVDYCNAGYPHNVIDAGGLPMGGTMTAPPTGAKGPSLIVSALKDEDDIARIDIVKSSIVGGAVVESVVQLTPTSPSAPCVRWQDPAFDPKAPTLYYVRVLQVPTWRWSHYDCLAAPGTAGCETGGTLDVKIQERAWTSPIWWMP